MMPGLCVCGSEVFIPGIPWCLIWRDWPRLAAEHQKLCHHLSLAVSDLEAHAHKNHCPANGCMALQGQSSGTCSFGTSKETPHKHLFVTVCQVPCTEAAQRRDTHSGGCSVGAARYSRPVLPILPALALPTVGGKQ